MIGIIGAMEDEVALLRSAMEGAVAKTVGQFEFISGNLEKKAVVLLRCGIGKVNAAVGCALLVTEFAPDFVINTGSAGGIDPSLNFGDAVISNGLVYHDVDVTAFGYKMGQVPGCPEIFPVPADLINRAESAVDSLKAEGTLPREFTHVRGLIGSGDVFMHEPERIAEARKLFPAMCAVEMEGAAIAHACSMFSVPSLIIRALSDIAGTESPVTFDEFLPVASKHSSEIVRRIVRDS
ncbi:5'-methylthioadenosine/S-adenosylhomocysteine nucleosidase [Breznakiella homolactica]|uniref:5'-methylthioadenosine/S-adenosylhomocysteine nucleosidase n=1 Tax=Breznakiella homolactica TaxID=2798577 RepID=A0A7T7XNS1_9SPIR|nr:5'-methylthioadenosine/S-adenosylhomocysteine nucleosidase [Breznakiella homolactica]QQO09698.1 5'-methylthioadenosine/S-adenosylhomocysteine nucleosidase [Breznakiella homolactica]